MNHKLIFVRHSHSQIMDGIPPHQWALSGLGRQRCLPLAGKLEAFSPGRIVSSTEPKAVETAQITARRLNIPADIFAGIHEHERHSTSLCAAQEFRSNVRQLLLDPDRLVFGSETGAQALGRFSKAVDSILQSFPDINLVVVTHGTVLSLYLQQKTGIEPVSFWNSLGLPHIVVLSRPGLDNILHSEAVA